MYRYLAIHYVEGMLWNEVSHIFEVDGSLRDIIVRATSVSDWTKFINLSQRIGVVSYQCDGEDAALPSAVDLFDDKEHAHCMRINLGGPIANAHFFDSAEIELDLDPREIRSQATLDKVLNFCSKLSVELERDVAITEESNPEATMLCYSFQNRSWQVASYRMQ